MIDGSTHIVNPTDVLGGHRIVPVVVLDDAAKADALGTALVQGGLPVAEALSIGLPVLTSRYGSTAQIAEHGGCVLIDPESDEEITDGMRRLLTSPELVDELRLEAAERPERTWDDYARELWAALIGPSALIEHEEAPRAL